MDKGLIEVRNNTTQLQLEREQLKSSWKDFKDMEAPDFRPGPVSIQNVRWGQ